MRRRSARRPLLAVLTAALRSVVLAVAAALEKEPAARGRGVGRFAIFGFFGPALLRPFLRRPAFGLSVATAPAAASPSPRFFRH